MTNNSVFVQKRHVFITKCTIKITAQKGVADHEHNEAQTTNTYVPWSAAKAGHDKTINLVDENIPNQNI